MATLILPSGVKGGLGWAGVAVGGEYVLALTQSEKLKEDQFGWYSSKTVTFPASCFSTRCLHVAEAD